MKKHQLAYQKYNRMNRDLLFREWVIMWYKGYFEKFSPVWRQPITVGAEYEGSDWDDDWEHDDWDNYNEYDKDEEEALVMLAMQDAESEDCE